MKTEIIVKLTFEGVHCWKDCNLKNVEFIKNPHWHLFYLTAKKPVEHNDRQIEIIDFRNKIKEFIWNLNNNQNKEYVELGNLSCENICSIIQEKFDLSYIEILEDNLNGACIAK